MNLTRIFTAGMLISFFGALPLGTMNVAALQLLMTDGLLPSFYFIAGCIMVEVIYVRLSLLAMDWIVKHEMAIRMLNWLSLIFMLVMAVTSMMASVDHGDESSNVLFSSALPPFVLGFLLMAANVTQIPFWFGWNTVLYIKKVLLPEHGYFNMYILGICLGSLVGNCLFVFFGEFVLRYLGSNQYTMNAFMGAIFAVSALIHYLKMSSKPSAVTESSTR
jgi:hypothetical protein